jgi:hypothetical protein
MPSRQTLAVALAALVLLSGCSMLPGGGGGAAPAAEDGPDHHVLEFYSHTNGAAYNGTLSVRQDGETVHRTRLDSDGTGTYLNVTTLNESGPYTVVVNTTLPDPGGETMHEEHTIDGTSGNATVVAMDYQGAQTTPYPLGGDDDATLHLDKQIPEAVEYPIRVTHRGETLVDTTVAEETTDPFEVASLRGTGLYRIEVQGVNDNWTNETVVLTESGAKIAIHGGAPPELAVYGPDERVPDDP